MANIIIMKIRNITIRYYLYYIDIVLVQKYYLLFMIKYFLIKYTINTQFKFWRSESLSFKFRF